MAEFIVNLRIIYLSIVFFILFNTFFIHNNFFFFIGMFYAGFFNSQEYILEPLSIISVIFQLASAAPEFDKFLQNDVNKTYTRTEAIEIYRTNMNKNSFKENIN